MTEPLLSVRDLHVSYRSGTVRAVRGVDLSVRPGEVVAVVGESGSGKSTTAQAVLGLLAEGGRVDSGEILFAGRNLARATDRGLRAVRGREIGLIPQDPMVALNPVQRVGDQVAEVLRLHGLADRRNAGAVAVETLRDAGLADAATRARQYPHELSGGMRQRVLIAIAIAARPKLLIADEPTSALDVTVQRLILDHIAELVRLRGTAVLLITHDLGVAADRSQRIAVMSRGVIVETGSTSRILQAPTDPYTRGLLDSAPSLATGGRMISERTVATDSPLLTVRGVVKDFPLPRSPGAPRSLRAVAGVDFTVHRGETFALVGESGSGKSTIARLSVGLIAPTAGSITFDGHDLTTLGGGRLRALRRRMQLVYQNPYASLNPRFTIGDAIAEPLRIFRVGDRAARRERVRELVDRVALPASVLQRKPAELSGGQRQRVAIARALALSPDLLVCDEPVSSLDVSVQHQVLRLLVQLQEELGLSYLFISHDLAVVRQVADRVGVMRAGSLIETGTCDDIFASPREDYTRRLLESIPGNQPTLLDRSH